MNRANFSAQVAQIPSTDTVAFPGAISSAGSDTVTGNQAVSGTLAVTGAATFAATVAITGPGITTTAIPTANHGTTVDLVEIAATAPVNTTGTNVLNFLTIDAAIGNASGGTNSVVGLQIDAITGDAQVTETAINIGSGWDSGITCASPATFTGGLLVGTSEGLTTGVAGIHRSANVSVAVPTIADAEVDEVAVDVSTAFTVSVAVGDMVFAAPAEALPTDCLLMGAYVSATDTINVSFGAKEGGAGVTGASKNIKFWLIKA